MDVSLSLRSKLSSNVLEQLDDLEGTSNGNSISHSRLEETRTYRLAVYSIAPDIGRF